MDNSKYASSFEEHVSDVMSDGNAIELIQPWGYVSVKTTPRNTGMPLGGIGSAVTGTPAGTTPSLHFVPGYFIESTDSVPVKLTNYFFRERPASYERIHILDLRIFRLFLKVTPLVDPAGIQYFDAEAAPDLLEKALARVMDCPTFYKDNKENLSRWNLVLSDISKACVSRIGTPHKQLNFNILLDIFPDCLTGDKDYITSLTADIDSKTVDGFTAYPAESMRYRCLYPMSETTYVSSAHKCKVVKKHVSPIAAGDAKLCSLPFFQTQFIIENPCDEALDIAIMQIQENIVGYEIIKSRTDEQDAVFYLQRAINDQVGDENYIKLSGKECFKGVTLKQKPGARQGDIDGEIHLGVLCAIEDDELHVTSCGSNFTKSNLTSLINSLRSGRIMRRLLPTTFTGKEPSSGAICVNRKIKPGESVTISFITVLDFPHIRLKGYCASKKYAEYFPNPVTRLRDILQYLSASWFKKPSSQTLPRHVLDKLHASNGRRLICHAELTQLLANGMAFLPEATIWDDKNNFYIRECVDYPFFNSLDVYFYGSFGLMYLLPEVDTHIIKAFSDSIFIADPGKRRYSVYRGLDTGEIPAAAYSQRRIRGAVPHDMGGAFDMRLDSYSWKDAKTWKDLAPKYVLLVLRNHRHTKDLRSLRESWPAVNCALDFLTDQIESCHNIPFVHGTSDTFDNLSSYGISIYSGSLWVAGLRAASEIAGILKDEALREKYADMADEAQMYLRNALWDEERGYYHYYSMPLSRADVNAERIQMAKATLENLGVRCNHAKSSSVEDFVIQANEYIYDHDAPIPQAYLKMYAKHAAGLFPGDAGYMVSNPELSNRLKKIIKKYCLYAASNGLIKKDFEAKIFQESDDIFADQLIADLYLSLLGLAPITSVSDKKRALKNIFSINYKTNSPNIGAANLVTAGGQSLPEVQAQDIWVGVQCSIVANLLDCGMFAECDELIMTLHRNIYSMAKIPFGIPEAFNCNNCVTPQDLTHYAGIPYDKAKLIVADFQGAGIVSDSFNVIGSSPDIFTKIIRKHLVSNEMSKTLFKLLGASLVKYSAGRYFRAGMIYSILAVIEKKTFEAL